MIDPQLQGIRWLRRHEEVATEANGRSLHVLQMGEVCSALHIDFTVDEGGSAEPTRDKNKHYRHVPQEGVHPTPPSYVTPVGSSS